MCYPLYFKTTDDNYIPTKEAKRGIWALLNVENGYRFFHIQDDDFITDSTLTKIELETMREQIASKVNNYVDRLAREGKDPPSLNKLITIVFNKIIEAKSGKKVF